jgi:hypothetical protein
MFIINDLSDACMNFENIESAQECYLCNVDDESLKKLGSSN